jgi:hypothetical protein
MSENKRTPSSKQPSKIVAYRQGEKTVYMEPVVDRWAVRFVPKAESSIKRELAAFGEVDEIPSLRLLVLKLARKEDETALTEKAKEWIHAGKIEFFQPVLRDMKSRLQQIPTDEISVRFKQLPTGRHLRTVEKKYGVKVHRQNEFVPNQFVVKAPATPDLKLLEVASKLDAEDDVEFAAPNFLAEFQR